MMRRILVADDNIMNRQLLRKLLENEYEVLEAADGREALEMLRRAPEDVSAVLLDIVMPEMDGFEVLKSMRADPKLARIPVIVATGSVDESGEICALSLGANDYVTKPYNPDVIRHRIWNTINLRESAAVINAVRRDELTGLYNRGAFFDISGEMIGEHEPGHYVMACFDIDNFKVINDQYGSKKGDEVLKFIAGIFERGFTKAGGVCCRITADNFAVLYPRSFMESEEIAEMRRAVVELDGSVQPITFSIGRYIVEDTTLSVSAMYDRAAMAQLSVKGRFDEHIAHYNESMRQQILREQEIINEMAGALRSGQFEAWLQPQYNHATGALIGAEALARWRHPKYGIVPPGDFIPVFDRNGFIYELDKYIWEQVCILIKKWREQGRAPLPVSVNISRYDVFRSDLIEVITGLTQKYGIPHELLCLEITESAFARSASQIISVVKKLIENSYTVEIDDFGSGYSSLNTLKDVPADVLKLDMRFLEDEGCSSRGGNILESVIRMAKRLGMPVIAEGVESIVQADYLKSIGCFYIQGYLYARPMQVEEFEKLMDESVQEHKRLAMENLGSVNSDALWNPKSIETLIFSSYVGGACIFEYSDGRTELLRVNEKFARELIGGETPWKWLCP